MLAQTAGPDPQEIPIPPVKIVAKAMPGVDKLPVRSELPDILTMNDGTKVTTVAQWERRRQEIKRTLEYYAVGTMPPPPGNVRGEEVQTQLVLDGKVSLNDLASPVRELVAIARIVDFQGLCAGNLGCSH